MSARDLPINDETFATLDGLLGHASDMVAVVGWDGACTYASPAVARISGFDPQEVIGQRMDLSMHPDDRVRVMAEAAEQFVGGAEPGPIRFRQVCKDGGFRFVEALFDRLPDGHPLGAIVISTRDVTDRVEAERAHAEGQEVVRMVAEGKPLVDVLEMIVKLVERRAPGATACISRLEEDEAILRFAAGVNMPQRFVSRIDGLTVGLTSGPWVERNGSRDAVMVEDMAADERWGELRAAASDAGFQACWSTPIVSTGADRVLGTLALYWPDPTIATTEHIACIAEAAGLATVALERFRIEGELAYQATHDSLTGLPNRSLLQDRIDQALSRRRRRELGEVAVLFVDLDRFKAVNDEHGHGVGDALLCEVAERLTMTVRQVDTVARLGGDEFIIVAHTKEAKDIDVFARRINDATTIEFAIGDGLHISCSIGVAFASDDDTPTTLIRRADAALYEAKQRGRNCYVVGEADATVP